MANIKTVTPDIITAYQQELMRSTSPATAKRKEASLNKFFNWAEENGHIDKNPMPLKPEPVSPPLLPDVPITTTRHGKAFPVKTLAILGITFGLALLTFAVVSR